MKNALSARVCPGKVGGEEGFMVAEKRLHDSKENDTQYADQNEVVWWRARHSLHARSHARTLADNTGVERGAGEAWPRAPLALAAPPPNCRAPPGCGVPLSARPRRYLPVQPPGDNRNEPRLTRREVKQYPQMKGNVWDHERCSSVLVCVGGNYRT